MQQCGIYQDLREGKLVANLLDGTALTHMRTGSVEERTRLVLSSDTPIDIITILDHFVFANFGSIPRISHVLGYRNADVLGERLNPWQFFQTGAQSRNRSPLEFPHGTSPLQPASNEACEQLSTLNCPQRSCGQSLHEDGMSCLADGRGPVLAPCQY